MFDNRKLRKYADCIIGFAYEQSFCDIRTYLVISLNGIMRFIPYRNAILRTKEIADEFVKELENQDYKKMNYWVINNQENKKLTKSIENPISYDFKRPRKDK